MTDDAKKPEIFIAEADEWKGHPHGQFLFDRPGLAANFAATHDEINDGVWAKKLGDFLASDEPFLVFQDPHFGNNAFLTRAGAEHVFIIACAKSAKVAPRSQGGTLLREAESGRVIRSNGLDLENIIRG